MKRNKKIIATVMAILMVVGLIPAQVNPIKVNAATKVTNVDLTSNLEAGKTYGDPETAKIEVLENMTYKASSTTVDSVNYEGYVQGTGNPTPSGGDVPASGAVVKVTGIIDCEVTFVIKKTGTKSYYFVEEESKASESGTCDANTALKYDVKAGKTYYFYVSGSKACIYGISIKSGSSSVDWNTVSAPVIGDITADGDKINVPFTAVIGDEGGESVVVNMMSGEKVIDSMTYSVNGSGGNVEFTGEATGEYTFKAELTRKDKENKISAVKTFDFVLPLVKPTIESAASAGNGAVKIAWKEVPEASSYEISYSEDGNSFSTPVNVNDTSYTFKGLTVDKEYTFKVVAKRETPAATSEVATITGTPRTEAEVVWNFAAFGQGVNADSKRVSATVNGNLAMLEEGSSVRVVAGEIQDNVFTSGNCGKIVPASHDGLAFYYTTIPSNMNFTLSANIKVNLWHFSNGQEGFGLMAADRVGTHGDSSAFWNNSYMASVTRVQYTYDNEKKEVSDSGDAIDMKLGVGSQEKVGVTADNLDSLLGPDASTVIKENFRSTMYPMDVTGGQKGKGVYNMVGNYDSKNNVEDFTSTNLDNLLTEFRFTIQKNNTGYFVTYTNVETGESVTKKYYSPDALAQIDKDNVYVGFYASRFADVTFSDISFTTIEPSKDAPAEKKPITYVTPKFSMISESTSNTSDYEFVYYANADGYLTVKDNAGNEIVSSEFIKANTKFRKNLSLSEGSNVFTTEFTPVQDYKPDGDEYKALSSYDTVTSEVNIQFKKYGEVNQSIWVSPTGTPNGTGNVNNPLDIYTAVKYVQPGQTIVVKEGNYNLTEVVSIPRGTNGSEELPIVMTSEPGAKANPVFDFGRVSAGFIFSGDYWYVANIDVTNSGNGLKGIHVTGSNNTFDNVNSYYNGSTGLQISRLLTVDEWEDWPANNLVLNCSAYCNADAGYEDADGFAAKLTSGDGNVFDGCISHNNADDGWDLFAKVQTGSIGKVIIKNSVAYENGIYIDREGNKIDAGNGNGFKLGGDGLYGGHELYNSISYNNKAKGIDSNSCPDNKIYQCTSYNNGSYNIALYSNGTNTTDYVASNIVSYRKETNVGESIKPVRQDESKIYNTTNYFWNDDTLKSVNTEGIEVTDDWFVSLDTSIIPTRNDDGTINMNGLLVKTDKALSGGVILGTPSANITIPESVQDVVPSTGDNTNIFIFIMFMLISGAAVAGIYVFDKKKLINK